jgi:hypothetical protein
MAAPIPMPARGERAAPVFDRTKLRELPRFFTELEYLFQRANLTADKEMKTHVLRYVDYETEQLWKTFTEFSDLNKKYKDFKDAVLAHYPDATGDFIYSLRDMDLIIGERQRVGITLPADLADYHLKFTAVTEWLIDKKQLGELEQERAYTRGFQPQFLGAILNRLQIKLPDHHPSTPYKVKDVYDAAKFILHSAMTSNDYTSPLQPLSHAFQPAVPKPEPSIKSEDFGSLFKEFTKTVLEALNNNIANTGPQSQESRNTIARAILCLFCGGPHPIRNCAGVDEYIKAGKCKRNIEGKIVLSTGAFIPRDIPGNNFRERIDEWHRRNPNQLAAATLIHTIDASILHNNQPIPKELYQLSSNDRIATLEAELFNLRTRQGQASHIRTRAQKARAGIVDDEDEEEVAEIRKGQQPKIVEVEEEDVAPQPATQPNQQATTTPTANTSTSQPVQAAEHPYRAVKDATYQPPTARNIGAPAKTTVNKTDTTPKVLPPIYDPSIAANVYKRSLETPVTLTQRELLALAPEVRSQVREAVTTRRTPREVPATQGLYEHATEEQEEHYFNAVALHNSQPTSDSPIIVKDPVDAYYKSLRPGEEPDFDVLVIAKESGAVRSIVALVDNNQRIECILDPGCQIIAMSENVCHELGLAYDPSIKLNMQSANGNIDQSLGLSRNVPFRIHTATFYMQVHVIRSPAYDILLGRPFDILTESIVRNFSNEDQTITVRDPNTGNRVTIPTIARGPAKCTHQHKSLPVFRRPGA